MSDTDQQYVWTKARYISKCADRDCNNNIEVDDTCLYDTFERKMYCGPCGEELSPEEE